MNKVISILTACIYLLFCCIDKGYSQIATGTFSDTVYLLSVFNNSGDKKNKDENYYCAVFLDKESSIENLLHLKMGEYVNTRHNKHDKTVKAVKYVRLDEKLEQRINEEIDNHFLANPCIGAGMALSAACRQYLDNKDKTDPYYFFIIDTLFKSRMFKYLMDPDMLLGEITNPLVTGGLMIGCDNDPPCESWKFDYENEGTYYKLFKLQVDYLLLDDPNGCVLARSYEWTIYPGMGSFDSAQNVKIPLGDIGSPFISHLKVILKNGKLLTALPYSIVNLTKE